jgi:hypothetical protein
MFNPTSFSMHYATTFGPQYPIGASTPSAKYVLNPPKTLKLDLILDGTGVANEGFTSLPGITTTSVPDQINAFLGICFHMVGKIHQPYFLKLTWGDAFKHGSGKNTGAFDCRLKAVDVNYTSFDRGGTPLRAELKTEFIEDVELRKRLNAEAKASPDLTHTRTVKEGDTLPLLCKDIYGSSQYYLRIAEVNNLDNFRELTPGQVLIFPPLAAPN